MSALLSVAGLCAGYGRLDVLRGIDLTVDAGELVAVLGPNGAGKSTLLRAISGVEATVRSGTIAFAGTSLAGLRAETIARAGLRHVPEGRHLFGDLTVQDNIVLGAFGRGIAAARAALDEAFARFPALADRRLQRASALSGGEQQMLAIARALAAQPALLLLDEPSTGLAPLVVAEMFALISGLRSDGTAILLVEQNAALALANANRAYVFENGTIALSGDAAALANDPRVEAVYLGGATDE